MTRSPGYIHCTNLSRPFRGYLIEVMQAFPIFAISSPKYQSIIDLASWNCCLVNFPGSTSFAVIDGPRHPSALSTHRTIIPRRASPAGRIVVVCNAGVHSVPHGRSGNVTDRSTEFTCRVDNGGTSQTYLERLGGKRGRRSPCLP